MIEKSNVLGDDGEPVTMETEEIKQWFESDAIKFNIEDEALFESVYETIMDL
jgi:hypothetical protein